MKFWCHCQLSPVSWLLRNVCVRDGKICRALKLYGKSPKCFHFFFLIFFFNAVETWDIFLKELMGYINFLSTANLRCQRLWATKLSICQGHQMTDAAGLLLGLNQHCPILKTNFNFFYRQIMFSSNPRFICFSNGLNIYQFTEVPSE